MSKQFCRKDSTIHGVGRLAEVLFDGSSLKGVGETLCVGAPGLFLQPCSGDCVGTHLDMLVNLHRDLLQPEAQCFCDKCWALRLWHTRPELWSIP